MASLQELAQECRRDTAMLAIRIRKKKERGDPAWEIHMLEDMQRDLRERQRVLDGYYDVPRDGSITCANMYAPKRHYDTDS